MPGIPQNINAVPSTHSVSLSWDSMDGVDSYDIEIYNTPAGSATVSNFVYNGLDAMTQYDFKIRAVNSQGSGIWSGPVTFTTLPDNSNIPVNLHTTSTTSAISLTWDMIDISTGYEVEVDSAGIQSVTDEVYNHLGLNPCENHTYRVRSVKAGTKSDWSQAILGTTLNDGTIIPDIPSNINATPSANSISLIWNQVDGASSYDVEIDSVPSANATVASYTYSNLNANEGHSFRIRAVNNAGASGWTNPISVSTLPLSGEIPQNLKAQPAMSQITLTWDAADSATGYDLEIDGGTPEDIGNVTTYIHTNLGINETHSYRVKAKVGGVTGDWSGKITTRTQSSSYGIDCTSNEVFDLALTAADIANFDETSFTVTYNPNELDVVDLCSMTQQTELSTGSVSGTGITITQYTSGNIVFSVDKAVAAGQTWSGIVNYIKLKSKVNGTTNLTYMIN